MDKITRERRSWSMSRMRDKDTKPELIVIWECMLKNNADIYLKKLS